MKSRKPEEGRKREEILVPLLYCSHCLLSLFFNSCLQSPMKRLVPVLLTLCSRKGSCGRSKLARDSVVASFVVWGEKWVLLWLPTNY